MAFTIESKIENGFNTIVLQDETAQASVEIIPACGAILHAFTVFNNGRKINVIDHYIDAEDFATNAESKGFKSCKLSPFVCRVKDAAYEFASQKYTLTKFNLEGSALHGLLYDAQFVVIDKQANDEQASVEVKYEYKGTESGYPFYYDCTVTYILQKDNALKIITTIVNKDEGLIPLQDGWHPYFTFGGKIDGLQLEFQSKEKILFDGAMIPTGEKVGYQNYGSLTAIGSEQFDDCFTVNFAECQPMCVLRDAEQKIQIEIIPEKSYPYLQIYTPPHRNSIAIENLSGIPNAFNNGIGLITLPPQESASFTTTYKITSLT